MGYLDSSTFAHNPPPRWLSQAEPWDRPALIASPLMSTLNLSESLWSTAECLGLCSIKTGGPRVTPLISSAWHTLWLTLLSPHSPSPPPPPLKHTWERLFGQLVVIRSWFDPLCTFDQIVAARCKPVQLGAQLRVASDWNQVRITRSTGKGWEGRDEKKVKFNWKKSRSKEFYGSLASSAFLAAWVMDLSYWQRTCGLLCPCYSRCGPSSRKK